MGARESLLIPEPHMNHKHLRLKILRNKAFRTQSGRCFYCDVPMWNNSPKELGLNELYGAQYRCTAEHLIARQDGGRDSRGNIVAAHVWCNQRRHQLGGRAPSPEDYRAFVRCQRDSGAWLSPPHCLNQAPPASNSKATRVAQVGASRSSTVIDR